MITAADSNNERTVTVWNRDEQRWTETTEVWDAERFSWVVDSSVPICNCGTGHECGENGYCGS